MAARTRNYLMSMASGSVVTVGDNMVHNVTHTGVEQHDQVLIFLSGVSGNYASDTVEFSLRGSYASDVSARTMYYYDYAVGTKHEVAVTATTAGLYEMPYAGGVPYLEVVADTATCGTVIIPMVLPRVSY